MRSSIIFLFLFIISRYPAHSQVSHPAFRYVSNDTVQTYASNRYRAQSALRYFLMGKNYRREWEQQVTLPVFRLSETSFKVVELGGGMQTKSLKLEDRAGKQWALRTIDKDVSGAMPKLLKNTFAQKMSQDQISAAMPYGVLIIGSLAKSAGILAAQPTVYFVADDTALGEYRSIFAHTVCMLEERDPGFESTITTEAVLRKVQRCNDTIVDQKALLKARLFDMLIADWDRHFDNWRWGVRDSGGLHYLHAIPRDRDWAFYRSGGLIPKLARLAALRFLINFQETPRYIKSLSSKAHTFDGMFLNGTTAADWKQAIHQLQQDLSDKAIEEAVNQLPASVHKIDSAFFVQTLKSRRDNLEAPVMKYYRFLAKEVQIEGTAEDEVFSIQPGNGGFLLQIFRLQKETAERKKIYERHFLRNETYQVTLNGLGGNDRFEIDEKLTATIKLKLNGGTGIDTYDLHGNVPVEVNDEAQEENLVRNRNGAKINLH
jgi:hypothetical protein